MTSVEFLRIQHLEGEEITLIFHPPKSWVRKINEIPSISFRPSLEQEEIRPSAHSERERKILVNFVSRGEYFRFVGAELCTVKINH
jgi:hypothetical protein